MAAKKTLKKDKKRLRAKVTIPGVDKPIYVSGYSQAELNRNKEKAKEKYIDGIKMRDITFHNLIIEWFTQCKLPTIKSQSTLNNWKNAINRHILPCFPEKQLARAVKRSDLQECINRTEGMSYIVTDLVCSAIKHSFDYAMADGVMQHNPSTFLMKPTPPQQKEKKPLTIEQEDAVLDAASKNEYGLMIYLLYYLGLRRGEMLGLQWGDFDFNKKVVHIQRDIDFNASGKSSVAVIGDLKTERADRLVPLPDALISILSPLRGLPNTFLVQEDGTFLTQNKYRTRYNKIMRDAGLLTVKDSYYEKVERWKKSGKKIIAPNLSYDFDCEITAHNFRHHYITAKVESGERPEVIMAIVGHKDYSTTINVYTHIKNRIGETEPTRLSKLFTERMGSEAI